MELRNDTLQSDCVTVVRGQMEVSLTFQLPFLFQIFWQFPVKFRKHYSEEQIPIFYEATWHVSKSRCTQA
jgi:hypothetical protein